MRRGGGVTSLGRVVTAPAPSAAPLRRRAFVAALLLLASGRADAFWLLGFSTARTLAPGQVGVIAGTGGQFTTTGTPARDSFTPSLAHAGIRVGLADGLDVGYRLVTLPLPFGLVGPTLASAIDLKLRLTPAGADWPVALVAGGAAAYLAIDGRDRWAWSPGGALMLSHDIGTGLTLTMNARYLYAAIPDGPGGAASNEVQTFGGSTSLRIALRPDVAIIPEVGLFRALGRLRGASADGLGFQYGAVLAFNL